MKSFIKPAILASVLLATATSASADTPWICERVVTYRKAEVGPAMCLRAMEDTIISLGFDGPANSEFTSFTDGITVHTLICNDGLLMHYQAETICSNNPTHTERRP